MIMPKVTKEFEGGMFPLDGTDGMAVRFFFMMLKNPVIKFTACIFRFDCTGALILDAEDATSTSSSATSVVGAAAISAQKQRVCAVAQV